MPAIVAGMARAGSSAVTSWTRPVGDGVWPAESDPFSFLPFTTGVGAEEVGCVSDISDALPAAVTGSEDFGLEAGGVGGGAGAGAGAAVDFWRRCWWRYGRGMTGTMTGRVWLRAGTDETVELGALSPLLRTGAILCFQLGSVL